MHWLERDDLLALTSGLHDEQFVQYGRRAVDPPTEAREEWRIFLDLTVAMGRPSLGIRGMNRFVAGTRAAARIARRPRMAFGPHWIDRALVTAGRAVTWRQVMSHPHGLVFGHREFGRLRCALRTPDRKIHAAPAEFVARTRELLAEPLPVPPPNRPFQLGNRRHRHSMNSWLNDLPGLHPAGKGSEALIHPTDAEGLGITTGARVRVFSDCGAIELTARVDDRPRPGVVVIDHGWGSRVFDPTGTTPPQAFGVNRNLLVSGDRVDPLSQTPALSSTYVGVEPVAAMGPSSATPGH